MAPVRTRSGIELCYETMGQGEPLVLVQGLGARLVLWPDAFCQLLADRGFRVIRFDNRDTGRSTWLDQPPPALACVIARALLGVPLQPPYTLGDMADDVVGLLDGLDIETAHAVGGGGSVAWPLPTSRTAGPRPHAPRP